MNLSLRIARRYLFAKKSTNAINIITGIAVFGIALGTAALILILAVFNGFEDLITQMFSHFDPELQASPKQGKVFVVDSVQLARLRGLDEVAHVSRSLEEIAFFEYKDQQDFGTLKGVDDFFSRVSGVDTMVREGVYRLKEGDKAFAVSGVGLRNRLGLNINEPFTPMTVYMARRKDVGPFGQPFRKRYLYPAGTFVIQQEYDQKYILAPLDFAQELMGYRHEISALEISLTPGARTSRAKEAVQDVLGDQVVVKDRYEQEEAFLKLMNMEKWLSYAIVSLMMLMVAFNMIGALWMVVLEKQHDIAILKSMGGTDRFVQRIFLNEGLLLTLLGIGIGFGLALLLYGAQKQFELLRIPGQFVVPAYPASLRLVDFLTVLATVAAIGLLASWPPSRRAARVPAVIREE